jgi:hypothetical protein
VLEVMQFTVFYLTRSVQLRRYLAPQPLTSLMIAMDTIQRWTYLKPDTPLVYYPETSRSRPRLRPCLRNPAPHPASPRPSRPLSRPPLLPPPVLRHLLLSLSVGLVIARRPMPNLQQSWFIGRSSLLMRISRSLRTKGTR